MLVPFCCYICYFNSCWLFLPSCWHLEERKIPNGGGRALRSPFPVGTNRLHQWPGCKALSLFFSLIFCSKVFPVSIASKQNPCVYPAKTEARFGGGERWRRGELKKQPRSRNTHHLHFKWKQWYWVASCRAFHECTSPYTESHTSAFVPYCRGVFIGCVHIKWSIRAAITTSEADFFNWCIKDVPQSWWRSRVGSRRDPDSDVQSWKHAIYPRAKRSADFGCLRVFTVELPEKAAVAGHRECWLQRFGGSNIPWN